VELRSISRPYDVVTGGDVRIIPAGRRLLPHPALGFQGGGTIENDPQDKQGLYTKTNNFTVYVYSLVEAGGSPWPGVPGERVTLRFSLPKKPLLAQWFRRLERLIQGRVDI
jgi:hypothetical protein